jgi:hypothetical protein
MCQRVRSLRFFRFLKKCFLLVVISSFFVQPIKASTYNEDSGIQKSDSLRQKINLFGSDDLLEVSLGFDLTGFQRKSDKAGSFDGRIVFHPGQPDSLSMKVSVKHRGEYRYQTCSFPPIQLNFKKPVYAVADTGKIKKIKLVTHCTPGNPSDDYVLREYLVYKLYNVLTDTSFRVRLLRITYNDTGRKRKPMTQYGFFIEPLDVLASRTNNVSIKAENLTQHNLAIIKSRIIEKSLMGITIPYDFDLCGIVNADYGTPAPEMGLTSSRDRRFVGICRDRQTIENELKQIREKKEKLYSVINEFTYLDQRSKKDITTFLDQFFDSLEKQKDLDYLINNFLISCKKL